MRPPPCPGPELPLSVWGFGRGVRLGSHAGADGCHRHVGAREVIRAGAHVDHGIVTVDRRRHDPVLAHSVPCPTRGHWSRSTAGMLTLAFVLAGTVTSTLKGRLMRPPVGSTPRSMAPWGVGTRPAAYLSAWSGTVTSKVAYPGAVGMTPSSVCWIATSTFEPKPCERLSPFPRSEARGGVRTSWSWGFHISHVNVPPWARMLAQPGSDAVRQDMQDGPVPTGDPQRFEDIGGTDDRRGEGHAEDVVAHGRDIGRWNDAELHGQRVVDLRRDSAPEHVHRLSVGETGSPRGVQSVGVVPRRQQEVGVDGGGQLVRLARRWVATSDGRTAEGVRHVGDPVEHVVCQQVELRVGRELRDIGWAGDGPDQTVGADVAPRRSPTP